MTKPDRKFISGIARKAGKATIPLFGTILKIRTKLNPNDFVTEADLLSEKILIKNITARYPHHQIISEEGELKHITDGPTWIIDPLDGTRNFKTGAPSYGVMVAYLERRQVLLAAIYLPLQDDLYFAQHKKGAFLNGRKIHCSKTKELSRSYGCDDSYGKRTLQFKQRLANYPGLDGWYMRINCVGVSAGMIADGRRDYLVFCGSSGLWDYAAPALISKEAGCVVTNFKGKPWNVEDRELIASNRHLHKALLKLI